MAGWLDVYQLVVRMADSDGDGLVGVSKVVANWLVGGL